MLGTEVSITFQKAVAAVANRSLEKTKARARCGESRIREKVQRKVEDIASKSLGGAAWICS